MTYRIRTIAERTGVRAITLRSWERRYGFPVPKRTDSGYRAYSDEDLRQVTAVKRMIDAGVSVSEAVDQVRALPPTGEPQALLDGLLQAAVALAERDVERIVAQAEQTFDARTFCHAFALPALTRAAVELDVAAEHLTSAIIRAHLRSTIERVGPAASGRPIVLACPALEEHEGGLLAVTLELRLRGMRTLMLGANTPSEAIGAATKKSKARAVCLSFITPRSDANLRRVLSEVVRMVKGVPVIVGGTIARKRLKVIFACGASFADDAAELLALLSAP